MWGPDIYVCGDVNATVHAHVFVFVYAVIIYLRGLPVLSCCTCRNLLSVFVREGRLLYLGCSKMFGGIGLRALGYYWICFFRVWSLEGWGASSISFHVDSD